MEYELFRSELKPSVDGALVSSIIRSSSSGLHSHRAAVMELILERSIQERRERMFTKAKNRPRPGPTPQPESEARDTPTPQVRFPVPAPASQPPSRPPPIGLLARIALASTERKAPQDSSALSEPAKKIKEVGRHKEPPVDAKPNWSPSEDFVELICPVCDVKQLRGDLLLGVYCHLCCSTRETMWCVGCGTSRVKRAATTCSCCHKKFK